VGRGAAAGAACCVLVAACCWAGWLFCMLLAVGCRWRCIATWVARQLRHWCLAASISATRPEPLCTHSVPCPLQAAGMLASARHTNCPLQAAGMLASARHTNLPRCWLQACSPLRGTPTCPAAGCRHAHLCAVPGSNAVG
jgi:hypothetical protein